MSEVDDFLKQLDHPLLDVIHAMRNAIRANADISEHIKWNAPSFVYAGDDRITFNFSGKKLRVVFHCGAKKKELPTQRMIADSDQLLTWASNDRAIYEVKSHAQFLQQEAAFSRLVSDWLNCFPNN